MCKTRQGCTALESHGEVYELTHHPATVMCLVPYRCCCSSNVSGAKGGSRIDIPHPYFSNKNECLTFPQAMFRVLESALRPCVNERAHRRLYCQSVVKDSINNLVSVKGLSFLSPSPLPPPPPSIHRCICPWYNHKQIISSTDTCRIDKHPYQVNCKA